MTRSLVTGGSGYFGSLLAGRLLEQGHDVRVLDLHDAPDRPVDVEFVAGDIRDPAVVARAVGGVDVVFHNVAQVPLARDPRLLRTVNVDGTQNLLAAARTAGVGKVVHTSSSAVFGVPSVNPVLPSTVPAPAEPYGHAKLAAEWVCLDAARNGLDVSIVRPRTILGHGRLGIFGILFDWVADGADPIVLGDGSNRYQFVHADDLAAAIVAAGAIEGAEVFNIGTDRFGTMYETLDALCRHAGTGAHVRRLPAAPAGVAMRVSAGLGLTPFAPYHWLMYSKSMWFDLDHARATLDWAPRWSTDEMFAQSYDWFLAHRNATDDDSASQHRRSARQGVLAAVKQFGRVLPVCGDGTVTDVDVAQRVDRIRSATWWRLLWHTVPVYLMSRACVLAGAAVVAAELRVDDNLGEELDLAVADPHGTAYAGSAVRPMIDVLTSWDGLWYMDIVRNGYPSSVPPDVTYFVDEARAAFFPLFPLLGRSFDRLLPGGDSLAVLVMNTVCGLVAIVLIALIADHLYGERVARTTATISAFFPGSFVLSFAYSEALMLVLAAACVLMLLYGEWTAAGVFAALATATRPNGVALIVACAVAAFFAIRDRRDWSSLVAVLLAPLGFLTFQVWLGRHTGEAGVWFRVQREAWDEGASFGWTAIRNTVEAVWQPVTSPTDTITALSFVTTIALLVIAWKVKLPWVLMAYSWAIVALMLVPATVTARPRFLFTAFPLLIAAGKWFDDRRDRGELLWPMTMAACGAGLAALTGLYGVFGAIP